MAKTKDLTVGKPMEVLLQFCLPMFGSVIFQQLYNLADSFVAGKFISEDALAAVGNSYEITLIYLAFAFGCNIGCSVTVSQMFGARRIRDMKTAVSTALILTGFVCAVLVLGGLLCGEMLLGLVHTPENIMADSAAYLRIYTLSLPFVFFYNVSTGIFSALGDSRTPFRFLAVSSVSNIAVDILFVTVFHMGVAGVAWATLICQGVSCVLAVTVVFLRMREFRAGDAAPLFDWGICGRIAYVAIPSTLQQGFISVGNIILQGIINGFGSGVIAGYSAAVKLNNLVITSLTTVGNGVSNYTAQNLGAGRKERIPEGHKAACKIVWGLVLPMAVLYFAAGGILVKIFLDDPSADALRTGVLFLRIVAPFYGIAALKLVSDGVLRGGGYMGRFMAATFTDLTLRVVLAAVLSGTMGSAGIWASWPVGWCIATGMSVLFYRNAFCKISGE